MASSFSLGTCLALCLVIRGAGWEYDPSWTAQHPSDLDHLARTVAPDIFSVVGDGLPFDDRYANPCWRNATDGRLMCLPAFYLIGGFQCGARDLATRLSRASDIVLPVKKASEFWTRSPGEMSFEVFVTKVVGSAVPAIEADPSRKLTPISSVGMLTFTWSAHRRVHAAYGRAFSQCAKLCHRKAALAAGVRVPPELGAQCRNRSFVLDYCSRVAWERDPASALRPVGSELTMPWLMARAHGARVRVVALLRNPADRLWSAYFTYPQFWSRYGDSEKGVGEYFREQSGAFARCEALHGARACAMRFKSLGSRWSAVFYGCDQLIKSMYSVFVVEWIAALGRERTHFELAEDYFDPASRPHVISRVAAFVGLRLSAAELDAMAASAHHPPSRRSPGYAPSGRMSASLRGEMDAFYRAYNVELARMLDEPRIMESWPVHKLPLSRPT